MRRCAVALVAAVVLLAGSTGDAHHSFAVFFESDRTVTITGVVTEFRFTNPHGMITLEVTTEGGEATVWRAETNSPSVLRRRGWTPASLAAGEVVTIDGWPGRDGANYLRMSRVTRQDGSVIGTPMTLGTVSDGEGR